MAPRISGFTRASALGPIADFMDRQGGCVARVLSDVELPLALLEQPDILVPLREQFRFLERAARETGDECFGARLGQTVRMKDLSAFGAWVCAAETLMEAIERGHAGLNAMLQTATALRLERDGNEIRWWIAFLEPETEGRRHNELLGVGYMIDTVRTFMGSRWRPDVVMTALPVGTPRSELEAILGTNVSHGHEAPGIRFDAAILACGRPIGAMTRAGSTTDVEPKVPDQDDELASIVAVMDLAVHEAYPRIEWVAAKLGTTRRSLQRRLAAHGTTFLRLAEETLLRRAKVLLYDGRKPITDIALELGYAEPAHFTRAFRRWTGVAPSVYRAADDSVRRAADRL